MDHMKKFFSLTAAAVLLCISLAGCTLGKKLTAFGLYSRAAAKIAEAGGFEADCDVKMSIGDLDETTAMNINIKQNGKDIEMSLASGGQNISRTVIIGRDLYLETAGDIKLKYALPESDTAAVESVADGLPKLAEDVFESVDVAENDEDGTKSVTVNISGETAAEMFGSFGQSGLEGMSFDSAEITMYFNKNDDLDSMKATAVGKMTVLGFELGVGVDADYRFVNFGEAPVIELPEDADEYTDMGEYVSGAEESAIAEEK